MANGDEPKPTANLKLRDYLINLAIEDEMRAELNGGDSERARRKAAIERHNVGNPLDPPDVDALLNRDFDAVNALLRINQQNT